MVSTSEKSKTPADYVLQASKSKSFYNIFFHPDYTVGPGITPGQLRKAARGLYRRSGIAPCPEDIIYGCQILL
jgi:hypothetical protein